MNVQMITIHLHDMEFYAYHGVFEEEKIQGNTFLVNVELSMPMPDGCTTDCLEDTLNYQEIYDVVREEMSVHSDLLEHLVARIKRQLLCRYPMIRQLSVSVSKRNPPLGGNVPWVTVKL